MDTRSIRTIKKIQETLGVTVSFRDNPHPCDTQYLKLTSLDSLETYGIPLPGTVILTSLCFDDLKKKDIVKIIVKAIAIDC